MINCEDYFGNSRDNYNFFYRELKNNFTLFTKFDNFPNNYVLLLNGTQFDNIKRMTNQKYNYYWKVLMLIRGQLKYQSIKKIFTWNDDMIDNKKYYAFDIPNSIPKIFHNKKLCCTIAGNKSANHPDELYTKRVDFIRWFEKKHLDEFDLYGTKWDQYRFGHSFVGKILNKIKFLRKPNHFPSYKGMIDSKL